MGLHRYSDMSRAPGKRGTERPPPRRRLSMFINFDDRLFGVMRRTVAVFFHFLIFKGEKEKPRRRCSAFFMGIVLPLQIIPTIFLCKFLHLSPYLSAIFVFAVANFAVALFLYTGFLASVPRELDESAIINGAGPLRMFFKVIFPQLMPVTVTEIIVSLRDEPSDYLYRSGGNPHPPVQAVRYFFPGGLREGASHTGFARQHGIA